MNMTGSFTEVLYVKNLCDFAIILQAVTFGNARQLPNSQIYCYQELLLSYHLIKLINKRTDCDKMKATSLDYNRKQTR